MQGPPDDRYIDGFDTLVQRLSVDRLVLAELGRRCAHLLDAYGQRVVWGDDVRIAHGNYGTYSVQIHNNGQVLETYPRANGPDIELIETRVIPVLRKHKVLDDLSNA